MNPDNQDAPRLTASQRLALALGRAVPEPLSADQREALERAQDKADADAEQIWGVRGRAAA